MIDNKQKEREILNTFDLIFTQAQDSVDFYYYGFCCMSNNKRQCLLCVVLLKLRFEIKKNNRILSMMQNEID